MKLLNNNAEQEQKQNVFFVKQLNENAENSHECQLNEKIIHRSAMNIMSTLKKTTWRSIKKYIFHTDSHNKKKTIKFRLSNFHNF